MSKNIPSASRNDIINIMDHIPEADDLFRKISEKSLVGIYLIQDNIFKYVNPKFAEIFHYVPEEIINKLSPVDLSAKEDAAKVENNIAKRISGNMESLHYEFNGITKDKKIIHVEVFGNKTTYLGKPAIIGTLLDSTDRKKTIENSNLLKYALRSTSEIVVITDLNYNILFTNEAFEKAFLYSSDEVIGKHVSILYPDHEYEKIIDDLKRETFRFGWEAEILNRKKDGTIFPLLISTSVVKDEDNNVIAIVGVSKDISEKKRIYEQIRKLSQAVEQSPITIMITDLNGNIEYVNPTFTLKTGYTFEEIKGKNASILSSGKTPDYIYNELWQKINSGENWVGEFINQKKDGELYWEFTTISPIKNDKNKTTHFLAIKEDITERKNTEFELKNAKEKAEELNKLKSIFLANMSHELRTPMIGILGYAESLVYELENLEHKEMAATLLKSANRLRESLDSILDLSRIESNKMDLNLVKIKLSEVVFDALRIFKNASIEKNITLKSVINDVDLYANLDRRMVMQSVENLINNALKFTKKGEVIVELEKEIKNGKQYAVIKVKDTGIGISKEKLNIIFEPFRQASEGYARSFEGTGLGLTITKKFVEMMNGEISVTSELEKGSVFKLSFPAVEINQEKENSETSVSNIPQTGDDQNKISLLLVENDLPTIGIMKLYLQEHCFLDYAKNGSKAVELSKEKTYDLILMDIDLGLGINGIEAAKQIKMIPGYEKIPIVAVTAYAMAGDKEKFLRAGFTSYLPKPFDKKTLLKILDEYKK